MGFLMGAYGKLMAGKLRREIEYQLGQVSRRAHKITREIANKERMYATQERNMKSQMQAQMQSAIFGYMGMNPGMQASAMNPMMMGATGMDMNQYAMFAQMVQMQYSQAQSMWQNMFEMQKQADLQALKDLEDSLQIENDNLKSRLQIAQQEYEAYKQEEKADAKSIVPEYTAQA